MTSIQGLSVHFFISVASPKRSLPEKTVLRTSQFLMNDFSFKFLPAYDAHKGYLMLIKDSCVNTFSRKAVLSTLFVGVTVLFPFLIENFGLYCKVITMHMKPPIRLCKIREHFFRKTVFAIILKLCNGLRDCFG